MLRRLSFLAAILCLAAQSHGQRPVVGKTPGQEEAAIKALRGYASNIQKNRDGTVRFVRFSKPVVKDEHVAHVAAFTKMDYLAVVTPEVTDKGLLAIRGLTNLDSLVLTNCQLTDDGLSILEGSQDKLEVLYLDHTKITSAGLGSLSGLKRIRTLWLEGTKLTDDAAKYLKTLESLESLSLSGTEITDKSLEQLADLKNLKSLFLDRTPITGNELNHLSRLPKLTFLSLAGTKVTPQSLSALANSKSLTQLNLYNTGMRSTDLASLKKSMPKLRFAVPAVSESEIPPIQRFLAGKKLLSAHKSISAFDTSSQLANATSQATPDFQRHVMPLLGRLGCNGRTCHGSFKGQGGFTLSMFGYDFASDWHELHEKDESRVVVKDPAKSLILRKPTGNLEHGGGKLFESGSWQFRLLRDWIAAGATKPIKPSKLLRLDVTPKEIIFARPGDSAQLRVTAVWESGHHEDVTRLTRFETKNDQIATVSESGMVRSESPGDTHVLAMYDKGVSATPAMLAVSDRRGENYPNVPTPTKIDELVIAKLAKLGILPSQLSSDADFLRRVYLDITGTLPTPHEVRAFLNDPKTDKRKRVVDRLLETEAYATWWGLWLADLTGSNTSVLGGTDINWAASSQWQAWLKRRVKDNDGWDKTAAAILLATSRPPNQSYDEYAADQSLHLRRKDPKDATRLDFPMHYYWFHGMRQQPVDRALSIGYVFMGVRLQCAQCHKHPFDQWSKQDFDQFSQFFSRMTRGQNADSKVSYDLLRERLGVPKKLDTAALRRQMYMRVYAEGLPIPYIEVVVRDATKTPQLAKLPGQEPFDLNQFPDPREPLVEWLLRKDNPYFARSFVNRIWARYFGRGIVDPPDDFNIGNPPSNAALLDWLAAEFIRQGYDMKWLHRTIANSRTYQLSHETNMTNSKDDRHFSHTRLRRLQAEVLVDAMIQVTHNENANRNCLSDVTTRRIAKHPGTLTPRANEYALMVFGKPTRSTNCDCERKVQPTLLQSLYTRNDAELLEWIERSDGWVAQVAHTLKQPLKRRNDPSKTIAATRGARQESELKITPASLVEEAWLRSLSRPPTVQERERSIKYLEKSETLADGLKDLLWALLNTQEFLTNH